MFNSIGYLENRCHYNDFYPILLSGVLQRSGIRGISMCRTRRYYLVPDPDSGVFLIVNGYGVCVGMLGAGLFGFRMPLFYDISLNLVSDLLAQLIVSSVFSLYHGF